MSTWYRVSRWAKSPEVAEVARETDRMIILKNGRRYKKITSYEMWFPSEKEALDRIAEIQATDNARKDRERIRNAAPDLLEALKIMTMDVEIFAALLHDHRTRDEIMANAAKARAAIARATGEQP